MSHIKHRNSCTIVFLRVVILMVATAVASAWSWCCALSTTKRASFRWLRSTTAEAPSVPTTRAVLLFHRRRTWFKAARQLPQPKQPTMALLASSTTTTDSSSSIAPPIISPVGGDFVGLTATLDAQSGQLIPVPEYLIPSSFLEWGYPPSCLESIMSEHMHETNRANAVATMSRQTLTIYPAAGCDVDNLNTSPVQREEFQLLELHGTDQMNGPRLDAAATDTAAAAAAATVTVVPPSSTTASSSQRTSNGSLQQERLRMEACFAWMPQPLQPQSVDGVESIAVDAAVYRTRVQVEATMQDQEPLCSLLSPICVSLERQISLASSGGNGGLVEQSAIGRGLDGRTVSQWLGPILSKRDMQSFAAQDTSAIRWIVSHDEMDHTRHDTPGATTVPLMVLPGNVTVGSWTATAAQASGDPSSRTIVEIGWIDPTTSSRHVVQFTMPISSGCMNTALPSVVSRIEHGHLVSC
jgi:hypothetical protein